MLTIAVCDDNIQFAQKLIERLRKLCALIFNRGGGGQNALLVAHLHCRKQAAYADSDGTEVVYLVDFEKSIKLVVFVKNFGNLVGRYRVKSASE